ncbi:unnamed protein product [Echinostoma caproni]|uniref:AAA_34 domain-containing protein n=1 Tax=Echinostoma caproni TaxID=27848 RepID=A0A182ZZH7_9TREM|nr:unnamed protein product [Echinostoma caproni]
MVVCSALCCLIVKLGSKHPDPVVESSSLSSVVPPEVHYQITLPDEVIDRGCLSALQLEAVVYACQRHECILPNGQRAGFLIGDGAGVGKGRTIAGILYENYIRHRKKAIWLSVSNDLKVDAERDLRDVGLGRIKVHSLNKVSGLCGPYGILMRMWMALHSSEFGHCTTIDDRFRGPTPSSVLASNLSRWTLLSADMLIKVCLGRTLRTLKIHNRAHAKFISTCESCTLYWAHPHVANPTDPTSELLKEVKSLTKKPSKVIIVLVIYNN